MIPLSYLRVHRCTKVTLLKHCTVAPPSGALRTVAMFAALRRALSPELMPALARHATKKTGGTGGNTRTSNPKYLGLKIYGDQFAKSGAIIMRQRGAKYKPGENVGIGRDYTLYALCDGFVEFTRKRLPRPRTWIHVRAHSAEEHAARVKARVHARNNPAREGVWHKTMRGEFADRFAPKESPPETSAYTVGQRRIGNFVY